MNYESLSDYSTSAANIMTTIHNSIGRQPRAALALAVAQGLPTALHNS